MSQIKANAAKGVFSGDLRQRSGRTPKKRSKGRVTESLVIIGFGASFVQFAECGICGNSTEVGFFRRKALGL